ncbi:MAG: TIGR04282 family arsenosugar biosynthesis glycosyltransferase [Acidobacteriota bacterium]|nr:TIGR04282 family arsenosugar biosynthesis glycosyltransferase [Acidobacteriota bacterium]MDH3786029.1 TIGR04282 family arsenosugar biosynthesis glycosyltransferase [Acidobacteriota bacterium]
MPTLLLLTRRPRPGRVKTRLIPPLTPSQATTLYGAFLADQVLRLRRLSDVARPEVCSDVPVAYDDMDCTLQGEGDLGTRLARAFERLHDAGRGPVVAIATDAPTLADETIRRAFHTLDGGDDGVVAAAEDGGYVLLGTRRHLPELFVGIPWGGDRVFAETRDRLISSRLTHTILPTGFDVDDVEGLRRLHAALRHPEISERAPATTQVVRGFPDEWFR